VGLWGQVRLSAIFLCRTMGGNVDKSRSSVYGRALDFRFSLLDRALYFSILMGCSSVTGKQMLLAIAQRVPAETPGFGSDVLRLQRVAALKVTDSVGVFYRL
jgi:hypothetical protein